MSQKSFKEILRDRGFYLPEMPFWLFAVLLIVATATLFPIVMIARSRSIKTAEPRVHIIQDMGTQPRYSAQQSSVIFADGRANRPQVAGTVAHTADSSTLNDDHYNLGYSAIVNAKGEPDVKFFDTLPSQIAVDDKLLERGQERFNIYCSACHGYDGSGHGSVNERALQLMAAAPEPLASWAPAANFHEIDKESGKLKFGAELYPDGRVFNTISNGRGNMAGYSGQVTIQDRWAIVAYVRALQLSQRPGGAAKSASTK